MLVWVAVDGFCVDAACCEYCRTIHHSIRSIHSRVNSELFTIRSNSQLFVPCLVPATLGFIQRHQQQSIQFAWVAKPGKEGKKISHHQKETVWTTPEKVNTIHSNSCRLAMMHQRQRCLYLSHSEWGNCSTLQLHSQGIRQHLRLPRTKQGLKMCAESPQVRNRVRRVRFEVGPEVRR